MYESEQKEFEIKSLLSLIEANPEEFKFIEKLDISEIQKLKKQLIYFLQESQEEVWAPLAKVSKFLPNFINAKVSQDILGAKIAANFSYHLEPKDALGIASHFSTSFFCDVLEHLIPEKIEAMIKESPFELMRKAVNELIKRKNFFLIGSLIDYTPLSSVEKIAKGLENPVNLILISYNARNKERILNLFKNFDTKIIRNVIQSGLESKLHHELETIYTHADSELKTKTLNLFKDEEIFNELEKILK
jgi:hypothetical protein